MNFLEELNYKELVGVVKEQDMIDWLDHARTMAGVTLVSCSTRETPWIKVDYVYDDKSNVWHWIIVKFHPPT